MDYRSWLPDRRSRGGSFSSVTASFRRALIRALTRMEGIPATRGMANFLLRSIFDSLASNWEKIRSEPVYRESFLAALNQLPRVFPQLSRPPRRILDVACGTGLASVLLRDQFAGASVTGVDLSPKMVQTAQMLVKGVQFTVANARELPFDDGTFELVVTVDGVFDETELARVVAPGGALIITYTRGGSIPVARALAPIVRALTDAGMTAVSDETAAWNVWAYKPV
ncbi:MAG: methyltransferase domain-containing protein [Thermoleophilia bacterium]|nr:methyltransferase domain-containing protein [Thermoleophilia bacterium]